MLLPGLVAVHLLTYPLLVTSQCAYGSSLTFAKVAGFAPRLPYKPPLLYANNLGAPITAECYNRCRSNGNCSGFLVDYENSSCFTVLQDQDLNNVQLIYTPALSFFLKVCLPVPKGCAEKAWSVEYTPGYELIGLQHTVIPNIKDRWNCMGACMNQTLRTSEACLSANYYASSNTCTLSSHDKWTSPDSYIPTTQPNTDYMENQCVSDSESPACWHEPVYNMTSQRSDLQLLNVTQKQCGDRCETEQYFRCKAYTWYKATAQVGSQCLLHSDPSITPPGPTLQPPLSHASGSVYVQRISCVNMTVTCGLDAMTLVLESPKFVGRLFVQGHSEECGVQGRGTDSTRLIIPMPRGSVNKCNVNAAHAIGSVNRTMATTVVVVQNHQLIQTVNDRVIKVTCLLTESNKPVSNNVTLNATFNIKEPGVQTEITGTGGNATGGEARAKMSIVEASTGKEATDVHLGDALQLRIELEPPLNTSVVRAGHLVASSGLDSLLLLDWRGCPPQASTFPPLVPAGPRALAADFRAFRFPSSPLLMLSMVLTVCPTVCQPTDCGNGIVSYGRRRRSVGVVYQEVPLHLAIVVHAPSLSADNTSDILSASFGIPTDGSSLDGQICVSFLFAALLALFWLLLQCVILAICCCMLRKHKDKHTDTISLRHDFQPRHVTWADDNEIPSKHLRLSTPIET